MSSVPHRDCQRPKGQQPIPLFLASSVSLTVIWLSAECAQFLEEKEFDALPEASNEAAHTDIHVSQLPAIVDVQHGLRASRTASFPDVPHPFEVGESDPGPLSIAMQDDDSDFRRNSFTRSRYTFLKSICRFETKVLLSCLGTMQSHQTPKTCY